MHGTNMNDEAVIFRSFANAPIKYKYNVCVKIVTGIHTGLEPC